MFQLKCCGVESPDDWEKTVYPNGTLPHSCCPKHPVDDPCTKDSASKKGCLESLQAALEHNTILVGAFGVGVALVQVSLKLREFYKNYLGSTMVVSRKDKIFCISQSAGQCQTE